MEWRYLPKGRVKHALIHSTDQQAICGVALMWWDGWRGTGTQDEYERAAALPECERCTGKLGQP